MLTLQLLELLSVVATKGISRQLDQTSIPLSIDNICITPCNERDMHAQATEAQNENGHKANVCAIANGRTHVDFRGVKFFAMETLAAIRQDPLPCHIEWKPDIDSLPSLQGLLGAPEEGDFSPFILLEQMVVLRIIQTYPRIKGIEPSEPHLVKHQNWLATQIRKFQSGQYTRVPQAHDWVNMTPEERDVIYQSLSNDVALRRLECANKRPRFIVVDDLVRNSFDRMVDIYEGLVSPLEVMLEDDRWQRFFQANRFKETYNSFLSLLGHSRPAMKILEVGAGSGGTTAMILQGLHPSGGSRMYSEYVFTDTSSAFFVAAKEKFAQYSNVTYKSLDITKDPLEQGFEAATYDLVVCDNVCHSTDSNMAFAR
jgi:hypothetical protein